MKRWITQIRRSWHTHQLVLRPTFWAGEFLVKSAEAFRRERLAERFAGSIG